jgi:hypothetical protein
MNVYAVSIAGVDPASFVTWFQALATARNSGKRLADLPGDFRTV